MDRDELLRLLRSFETEGLEYVLIGATALGLHGVIRATEDVDLFVRATPENLARLRRALHGAYPGEGSIEEITDADLLGEYPSVRYYPESGDLYLDIMTRLGEAASYDTVEAEVMEVDGVRVRVATPRALYRLKKDTPRALDRRDADSCGALRPEGGQRVEKYRSGEQMNAAPARAMACVSFERFVRHCRRYRVLFPRRYPRGVFKFRTIEEAQAARETVSREGNGGLARE